MENVNIKSSLINSKPFENLKQSLIEVTEIDPNPDNLKFRIHTIEYINDVSDSDDDNFFYDCLEFVRFEDPNKESVAYTWPDGRIYLNMPNKLIETKMSVWDFIYDHECLHQLWDTWDVQKKIENKLGYCDTELLNIASDCVINDYLVYYRKKTPPSIGIYPNVLKKEFGVEYDRKKDTQYTLYLKLLKLDKKDKDNLKEKAEEIEGKLRPKTVKIKQDNSSGGSGGSGPNKQYSDDYIKGRKDAINDVLDKKVDPLKGWKPSNTGNDEYDKGYNECMKEIEDGLKDGIEISKNSNGGGGSENGLPKIPWDVENNDKNNGSNGNDSKNSDDAQNAADKAQDAANKAQDAANKAQKESKDDPSNKQKSEAAKNAQNAANKAKEAAKQAKAAADKAKAAKSKGDSDDENKHAQEAINKAKEAEQAAESAKEGKDGTDGNNSGNPLTSNDAKQAAKKARDAANKAKQAAAKASGDKKEKAKKEAERAEKAAQEAEEAAQASEDAKKNGDKKLEDKLAQDAIDKAKLAEDCANAAEEISQGLDGNEKLNNNTNQDGGKQAGKGGHVEPKIFDEKIAAASKKVIDKYKNKIGGTFGEFIKRCKESIACNDNGLAVDVQVGKNSWHDDLSLSVNAFVKKKVFQKKREYESTYKRIKRGSGYVKPGQPLLQGRQIRQNKMPLNIALYVDVSLSMNSVIRGVFKSLYAICDAINKRFGKEEVISETLFRTFIFNDKIKEIPYGKVANASGSTISLDDLCEYIYKKSGDYLINIIITDANFGGINEQKITKIVEENENLLVFVTNEHNQQVKNLADKFDTKIVYIFADDNFAE